MKSIRVYIGQCIYCGSISNLSDEHIIPFGLNGSDILEKASCKVCAEITSHFEHDVLRHMLIQPRTTLRFKTRRKKERPSEFSWILHRGKEEYTLKVPVDETPTFLILPIFPQPAHLSPRSSINAWPTSHWVRQVGGPDFKTAAEKASQIPDVENISFETRIPPASFLRMIAKIAYGYSVVKYGVRLPSSIYVLPAIRNDKDEIGRWVGNLPGRFIKSRNDLATHRVRLFSESNSGEKAAVVQLFSQLEAPEYFVVIGKSYRSPCDA